MKREIDLPPYVMPVLLGLLLIGLGAFWAYSEPAKKSSEKPVWVPRLCGPGIGIPGVSLDGVRVRTYTFSQTVNFLVRTEKTGENLCTPEQAQRILELLLQYREAKPSSESRKTLEYEVTQALTNDQRAHLCVMVDVPDDPGCGPG